MRGSCSAATRRSPASTSPSRKARRSPCSARAEAASRRCCGRSPGCSRSTQGAVTLDGRDLDGVPPHRRGIGLMFQDDALFPHRDVAANIAFGLRMQGEGPRGAASAGRGAARARRPRGARAPGRRVALGRRAQARRARARARAGATRAPARRAARSPRPRRSTTGSSPSCATCSTRSARPPSTSPTTWPRRSRSATASP